MAQQQNWLEIPYVRGGTGRLVRVLHLSPDHKAEIYEKPESLWMTQYPFVMVVLFKDKVVGMLASEASLVSSALLAIGEKAPERMTAALVSYHGTHRVNHGMSEELCTLDGFKSAAASTALDLLFPNVKGQAYYIESKEPIEDPHGFPERYLHEREPKQHRETKRHASLHAATGGAAEATRPGVDPELQKAMEHMFIVSMGLLSAGKSRDEVLQHLSELGCPREVASHCVEGAVDILKERQRLAQPSKPALAVRSPPENTHAPAAQHSAKSVGGTNIATGIVLLLLGALITGATYSAASGGGRYVVTTGLFLVGAYQLLKGIYRIATKH